MVDLEGFFALKYGEFGGIFKKKFGPKKFFGAFASPFFFCLQSGKKKFSQNKNKNHWTCRLVWKFSKVPDSTNTS